MEKIITDKNGFRYQLIGEIYYPIILGAELPLGKYSQARIEYLQKYHPDQYKKLQSQDRFHYDLFVLNCLCEQKFQHLQMKFAELNLQLSSAEQKKVNEDLKNRVLNEMVYQLEGDEFNE